MLKVNQEIRKVVIGTDPKNGMGFTKGQRVINNTHIIYGIQRDIDGTILIQVQRDNEIYAWKEINPHVPVMLEYNTDI
jgi:hypothetical protein